MMKIRTALALLTFLGTLVSGWGQFAGPVSNSGLKNGATLVWSPNQNQSYPNDGLLAKSSGSRLSISNVSIASSTTVYWTPTTLGISLDDTNVSAGERMSYRNSSQTSSFIPRSSPSSGFAVFYVLGYFSDIYGRGQRVNFIMRMTVTDSSGSSVALVETGNTSSGIAVPIESGQTYNVQLVFQIWNGSSWEAAYDYFNRINTFGNPGAAYTFEHGFFYDARPVSISLSSASINENSSSGSRVATLSVDDPNPTALSTSYSLVSGAGSTNNGNFSVSGSSLTANQSFNYEAVQSQSIRIQATNSYGSRSQQVTVSINDVNEAPTAVNISSGSIDENQSSGTVVGTLITTDPDTLNSTFVSPTFALSSSGGSSNDNYLFSINGSNQLVAQSSFDYEKQSSYTVQIRATDGSSLPSQQRNSIDRTLTISIDDLNDPPVAGSVSISVLEDQPYTFSLSGAFASGFSDEDATFPHTLSGVLFSSLPGNGTLSGGSVNQLYTSSQVSGLSYQGSSNYYGSDSMTYRNYDGSAQSGNSGTVSITVTPVNDPPTVSQPSSITFLEDAYDTQRYSLQLTGITTGPSNESSQTIKAISGSVTSGNTSLLKSISGNPVGNWFYFNSVENANGTATVTITVQDSGGTANGGIDSTTTSFVVNVTPVDDPPYLATPLPTISTTEDDAATTVDLSQYFKDVDSTLSFEVLSNVKASNSGNSIADLVTTSISGSILTIGLVEYSYGTATLTIQATGPDESGDGGSAKTVTGTMTVTVAYKDHPPQVTATAPASLTFSEDSGPLVVDLSGWFLDPDLDAFTALGFDPTSINQSYFDLGAISTDLTGTSSGEAQGSISIGQVANTYTAYTAADGTSASSPTSVTLTATSGGKSVSYSLPITIQEVNDPPTLNAIGNQSIQEGTDVHRVALSGISPGPNESTIDAVPSSSITATGGSGGVIDPSSIAISSYDADAGTGLLTYQLLQFQSGSDSITVTLADERGGTFSRTFTVKAAHVNQPPQVVSPLPDPFLSAPLSSKKLPTLTYLEDQTAISLSASGLFFDPDGDALTQTFFANTNPSLLSTSASGTSGTLWNLNLNSNQVGTADLVLRSSDGYLTADYSFTVSVTPVNDPPTLDPVGNVRINEGAAPKTISITGITTGPSNESDQSIIAITGEVTASSIDGLIASVSGTVPDSSLPSTGSLTFAVDEDLSGTATIRVSVQDSGGTANGGLDTAWREFNVVVNPVDDSPVLSVPAGTVTYLEDQFATSSYQTSVDLTGNFTDRDHDTISLRIVQITDTPNLLDNETAGRVIVPQSAPESIVLTFNENGNGTSTIEYGAIANGLVSNQNDTLTISVTPVNDPPTMSQPANQVVNEGAGPFSVRLRNISPGPSNESSQTVTITGVSVFSESTDGLISDLSFTRSDSSSGVVNYAVAANTTGTATIRVALQDDGGTDNGGVNSATYDFTVTVSAIDRPPVLVGSFPDQVFLEDQFDSNRGETKLDLTEVFVDPDGDAVSLILTSDGISDPDNILDDEDRLVVVDSSDPQMIDVTFNENAYGEATLTVGAVANGLTASGTISFNITVTPVNDAPTLDALSNLSLSEGAGTQSVSLSGITIGEGDPDTQNIDSITASVVSQSVDGLIDGNPAVTYSPNDATGTLNFSIGAGLTGTATIQVQVKDDGGTDNGGVDTSNQSFVVTVSAVDQAPVLSNPIGTVTFSEDDFSGSGDNTRTIDLSNVYTDPDGDSLSIVINSISDPSGIIDDNSVAVDSTDPLQLNITFIANGYGTATIRYRAMAGRAVSTTADVLTIEVTPSNDLPTLSSIRDQSVDEDSGSHTVQLSGIGPGENEDPSTLSVSAVITTQNPGNMIQDLSVDYTAPATTGSLSYTVGSELAGNAVITVTVDDGDGHQLSRSFDIHVLGSDDGPVVEVASDTYTLLEDEGNGSPVNVSYSGIFNDVEGDELTLFVHSIDDSADDVISDETGGVSVGSTDSLSLDILLNENANGSFSITTGASDGLRASSDYNVRTYTVTPVNDPPEHDPISNPTVDEDSAAFTVNISGITPGPGDESSQTVTSIEASVGQESVTGLIDSVSVDYTAGDPTAMVTVTLGESKAGTAVVNLSLQDDGGTANGGIDTANTSFLVTVNEVADPPVLVDGEQAQQAAYSSDALPSNLQVSIDLSGVYTDADGDSIQLVLNSVSDPEGIIEDESPTGLVFDSSDLETLLVTFVDEVYGIATINFQALAGGLFAAEQATLTIVLTPPMGAPSFDKISAVTVEEDSGANSVAISGVRPGLPPTGSASVTSLTAEVTSATPSDLLSDVSIDYTAGADSGTLHYTPTAGLNGTATMTITVTDSGATSTERVNTFSQDFVITVSEEEDPPYRDHPFDPPTFNEDEFLSVGGVARLDLTGVFVDDDGEPVAIEIRSESDPDNVLDDEGGHVATDPLSPQKLLLAFKENAFGSIDFIVGAVANGAQSSDVDEFTIVVNPVNDAPGVNAIDDMTITERENSYSASFDGISVGPANESSQNITSVIASVVSQTPSGLIENLVVDHSGNDASGTLSFSLGARFGTALVQLTVKDDGGTDNGGSDTIAIKFTVSANIEDKPPVLTAPVSDQTYSEDEFTSGGGTTSLDLSGSYVDPDGDTVSYVLGTISDPDDILANEVVGGVALSGVNNTALGLTIRANAFGTATLSYRGTSRGLFAAAYDSIQITSTPINDAPTLDSIANLSVAEGSGGGTVSLTGITVGPREVAIQSIQTATASVVSGDASILADGPSVLMDASGRSATLSFTPSENNSGTATIEVTLEDDGGTDDGGVDSITRSFTLTITEVDHPPASNGTVPSFSYTEDQFSASDGITTETLPVMFTDSDGDSVSLILGAISDPDDILDNEAGLVKLLSDGSLQLAFYDDAFGNASIPVYGFANGLKSTDPVTIGIEVTAVNDAPVMMAPSSIQVMSDSSRILFSVDVPSLGEREEGQKLISAAGSLTVSGGVSASDSFQLDSGSLSISGNTVWVDLDPALLSVSNGSLILSVQDDGGVLNDGIDIGSGIINFNLRPVEIPIYHGDELVPEVQWIEVNGSPGLLLDLEGYFTIEGDYSSMDLVPLGLADTSAIAHIGRTGMYGDSKAQFFIGLKSTEVSGTLTLAFAATTGDGFSGEVAMIEIEVEGAQAIAQTMEPFGDIHTNLTATSASRGDVDAHWNASIFEQDLPGSFVPLYRINWEASGNGAGIGSRRIASGSIIWKSELGPDLPCFLGASIAVPRYKGVLSYDTVAYSPFEPIRDLPEDFDSWKSLYGIDSIDLASDSDRDGFPLLLEFVIGLDPNFRDAPLLPFVNNYEGQDHFTWRIPVMDYAQGYAVHIEQLSAGGQWVPFDGRWDVVSSAFIWTSLREYVLPLDTVPGLFRIRAELGIGTSSTPEE